RSKGNDAALPREQSTTPTCRVPRAGDFFSTVWLPAHRAADVLALTSRTTENCGRCGTLGTLQARAAVPTYCTAPSTARWIDLFDINRANSGAGPVEISRLSKISRVGG